MNATSRKLALVTGASTGIGLELARLCAQQGFDLIVAADEPLIANAALELAKAGILCTPVQCDLATPAGVASLTSVIESGGRPVDFLLANAGRGLGQAFLNQDLNEAIRVMHTNIDGTVRLIFAVVAPMRSRGRGRVLITGSIAGRMPGSFQAVYNGSKAFLDSFAVALSNDLQGTGVTVMCFMPGASETEFFERAGMTDTKLGSSEKMTAAAIAKIGFSAMLEGKVGVVAGLKNRLRAATLHITPESVLAQIHCGIGEPGTGKPIEPKSRRERTDRPGA